MWASGPAVRSEGSGGQQLSRGGQLGHQHGCPAQGASGSLQAAAATPETTMQGHCPPPTAPVLGAQQPSPHRDQAWGASGL